METSLLMNFLGIDYGERRIGLSIGDELGIAVPLPAAVEKHEVGRLDHISHLVEDRGITDIIVGYPINMDESAGYKAREVDQFIDKLRERFRIPIHRVDERLTTYQAEKDFSESGKRPTRRSGKVDSRAATIILQDHLDSIFGPKLEADDSMIS
ncbi:MAG: Putative pre-16S rRNA nuclease [Candidatus Moanabacter tarae]|uniref:Putative pre-16S rRNA nuclease n=1 Tax=Candidatus Moanibacter tarae TaxID=2200854 RepID=A0A2Z4AAW9_9BACT|nr:MAG: Putative pre-16S rRNA nuclease [Candidatus Moanabacter tarae]|tara:strand:+ start:9539 stop:10000 length:462 start_codon:yes stop_codon:yes gene_type:complete